MLWYDNDRKMSVINKIVQAMDYYEAKYGRRPEVCFLHPSMPVGDEKLDGVTIIESRSIRPNYFLVGFAAEEEEEHDISPGAG